MRLYLKNKPGTVVHPCDPSYMIGIDGKIAEIVGGMTQVAEHWSNKYEALNSNLSNTHTHTHSNLDRIWNYGNYQ
jgi:hypothetical protein